MTIAIGQMRVYAGMPQKNKKTMLEMIAAAKAEHADIILFPELSIPGVLVGDLITTAAFLDECQQATEEIIQAAEGIRIVFGSYAYDPLTEDLQSSIFLAEDGKATPLSVSMGSDYIIDEYLDFSSDSGCTDAQIYPLPISGKIYRVGFILGCWQGMDFPYALDEIDLVIDLSARPVILDEGFQPAIPPCDYISVCPYGLQNLGKANYVFPGASFYQSWEGNILARADAFQSGLYFWSAEGGTIAPLPHEADWLADALVHGVRCFCEEKGIQNVVMGISGGIDSAVSACVYTEALGPEHVYLVSMPTHLNSDKTKSLAGRMATGLKVKFAEIPIEEGYLDIISRCESAVFRDEAGETAQFAFDQLGRENAMARERGRILMALSSAIHGIFTCNGNKTEMTAGYATFYGDLAGAFACLADLWKFQVYAVARAFQTRYPQAPLLEIADIRPSAELSEAQSVDLGLGDPLNYPYHDYLFRWWVEIGGDPTDALRCYLDGTLEEVIGCEKGLLSKSFASTAEFINDLEYWWKQYRGIAVAKRIQSPPLLALSALPFGEACSQAQTGVFFSSEYEKMKRDALAQ